MISINAPPPTPPTLCLYERTMLVMSPTRILTWEHNYGSYTNKREYASMASAISSGMQPCVNVTVDPITAVLLGLVTTDDLKGAMPDGFVALLNLLNK